MKPFVSFALATIFAGCVACAEGNPPNNYFEVDTHVSRGASLTKENVSWLKSQGFQTIIKLDDENSEELNWGIPVKQLHINKVGLSLTYVLVIRILDLIAQAAEKGRVYVHCEKGADRTGLIIGLYRVRNGWTKEAAGKEMSDPRFGHSKLQILLDYRFNQYGTLLERQRVENRRESRGA